MYGSENNQRDCSDPERGPTVDPGMIDVKDSSLECRGRNGWFCAAQVEVYSSFATAHISIFSRQTYGQAPIQVVGSYDDVVDLLKKILNKLQEEK